MPSPSGSTDPRATRRRALAFRVVVGLAVTMAMPVLAACDGKTRNPGDAGTALHIEIAAQDEDADVFIDGNYVGQVAEVQGTKAGSMRLAPGVHRFEVRKDGRFPFQYTLEIDPKKPPARVEIDVQLLEVPR